MGARVLTGSILIAALLGLAWLDDAIGACGCFPPGIVLAVLALLGPRIGRYRPDGTPRVFPMQNPWLVIIGLFLIYTGFWGFYAACNVPIFDVNLSDSGTFFSATNIYLTPTTLSAITVNFLMSLSGGLFAGYFISKGDPYWTFSGGLAGIITASAGNDLYHPLQALLIGAFGVMCIYKLHHWVERRFKIDDAVGAVAVHGYAGFIGVVIPGFVLWGYPSSGNPAYASITPWGQLMGAIIMFFVLGFLPCYLVGWALKKFDLLRIPRVIELAGLDHRVMAQVEADTEELNQAELAFVRGG